MWPLIYGFCSNSEPTDKQRRKYNKCALCDRYTENEKCLSFDIPLCDRCLLRGHDCMCRPIPCLCDKCVLRRCMCIPTLCRSRFRSFENSNSSSGAKLGFCTRLRPQIVRAMPPGIGRWGQKIPDAVYAGPPASKGSQSPVAPEWLSKGRGKAPTDAGTAKGKAGPSPPSPAQSGDYRNHVSAGCALRASDTGKGKTLSAGCAMRASDPVSSGCALRACETGKGKSSAVGKASAGCPAVSVGCALRAAGTGKGNVQTGSARRPSDTRGSTDGCMWQASGGNDPPDWRSYGPTCLDGKYASGLDFEKIQAAPLPDMSKGGHAASRPPPDGLEDSVVACYTCRWSGRKRADSDCCPACKRVGPMAASPEHPPDGVVGN